jgi:hypothetical protein
VARDLDDAALRRATGAALAAHPGHPGRFLALTAGPGTDLAGAARTVERQVFEESFGRGAGRLAPYEADSLFLLVLDRRTGLPAGAARLVEGGGRTLDDAPGHLGTDLSAIVARHDLHQGRIWDFATLAVLPRYRGGRSGLAVSSLLYRLFLHAGRQTGVRHLVGMLDHHEHRNLVLLGVPLEPMAGSAPFAYLGSRSTRAVHVLFAAIEPAIARQAARLRHPGATLAGEIRTRGPRRLLTRRVAARTCLRVATGESLDQDIVLPAIERRRLARQP